MFSDLDEGHYIRELAQDIYNVFLELTEKGNPIAIEYLRRLDNFTKQFNRIPNENLISFYKILVFTDLTNLNWHVPIGIKK